LGQIWETGTQHSHSISFWGSSCRGALTILRPKLCGKGSGGRVLERDAAARLLTWTATASGRSSSPVSGERATTVY